MSSHASSEERRETLRKRLETEGLHEELIEACLHEGDSELHRFMLESLDLPLDVAASLSHRGATRAVRNVAKQMLNRGKYKKKFPDS